MSFGLGFALRVQGLGFGVWVSVWVSGLDHRTPKGIDVVLQARGFATRGVV